MTPRPASTVRAAVALTDLADLLAPDARLLARAAGDAESVVHLRDVVHDSRDARPGVLMACRVGASADGHDFAAAAVAAGSPALLVQRPLDLPVPQLLVPDVAAALGPVSARVHGDPSAFLALLGVTGTNGKTTSAFLLQAALQGGGHTTGLVGTVHSVVAGRVIEGVRTTPEATDLQRLLRRMVDAGVTAAAMEVSSHGLALRRVDATRFAAAAFTNLTQDHLDFHDDLAAYESAKTRLFTDGFTSSAVVVVDGEPGQRIAAAAEAAGAGVQRLSVDDPPAAGATWTVARRELRPDGSTFTVHSPYGAATVRLRLPGPFNIANALVALATATVGANVDLRSAAAGLEQLSGVPGRMERVDAGQPFAVLVDYAHTPDSVSTVLTAARSIGSKRVLVVLGCGGDRDRGKRPLMGRAAATLADVAILTSDNPRSEDPQAILEAMLAGAHDAIGGRVVVEPDRRAAIALALDEAQPGDVVVIAGKGHETYQEIGGVRHPFDDRVVAADLLRTTRSSR